MYLKGGLCSEYVAHAPAACLATPVPHHLFLQICVSSPALDGVSGSARASPSLGWSPDFEDAIDVALHNGISVVPLLLELL